MATPDTLTANMPLAEDFEVPSRESWMALVDKALNGGDFEKRLVSQTADGIRLEPIYTRADKLAGSAEGVPGSAPFTRGLHASVNGGGWDIRQLHVNPDASAINEAILADLNAGVSSITIQMAAPGQAGLPGGVETLKTALKDVRVDWAPVAFAPGSNFSAVLRDFDGFVEDGGFEKSDLDCAINADPLGELAESGTLPGTLDIAFEQLAADLKFAQANYPKMRVVLVDARIYHEAGGTQGQELAALCATLVSYLRRLDALGLSPRDVLERTAFAVTAEADIFLTIAKLRAARRLIGKIAEETGAGDVVGKLHITASSSRRTMTKRDPWTNLLRTTTACAAAALGGANAVTVLPFTWALGRPDAFSLRTARNIQIVCQEESSLGLVIDPAGGSWYIEKLTEELAQAAWAQFQQIESEGGLEAALTSGALQSRIAEATSARAARISTGKEPLTGTSTFPFLADDGVTAEPHFPAEPVAAANMIVALTARRDAEPFEALRDVADAFKEKTGSLPKVFLASIGTVADHTARSTWIKNLFAAGGLEAITTEGFNGADDANAAFKGSGASVACVCSSDALYGEHGVATVKALKAAGASHVYVAGRPGALEADLTAAGVAGYLFAGQDAVAKLTDLHKALKVLV